MIRNNSFAILLVCTLCSACSSGSGSGSKPKPPAIIPPPAATQFGGLWFGSMTIDTMPDDEDLCGVLLTEDGKFRFLCAFTELQFAGMSSLSMNSLTGSGLAFSPTAFLDDSFVSELSIEATLVKATSLIGTWSTAAGDSGSFNLIYDAEYETPSSLALLEGVWQGIDEFGTPNASFTIDNLGSFTAQNANGCTSSGMFHMLDARYNLVQVDSTIVGCPIAGDYSGLAMIFDDLASSDAMLLSISNDQRALLLDLEKLP